MIHLWNRLLELNSTECLSWYCVHPGRKGCVRPCWRTLGCLWRSIIKTTAHHSELSGPGNTTKPASHTHAHKDSSTFSIPHTMHTDIKKGREHKLSSAKGLFVLTLLAPIMFLFSSTSILFFPSLHYLPCTACTVHIYDIFLIFLYFSVKKPGQQSLLPTKFLLSAFLFFFFFILARDNLWKWLFARFV